MVDRKQLWLASTRINDASANIAYRITGQAGKPTQEYKDKIEDLLDEIDGCSALIREWVDNN